jgi:hypothetical protein
MNSLTCLDLFKRTVNEREQQLLIRALLKTFIDDEPLERIAMVLDQLSDLILEGVESAYPPWSVRCAFQELLKQTVELSDKFSEEYLGDFGFEKFKGVILRLVPFDKSEAEMIEADAIQEFIDEEFCEHGAFGLTLEQLTKAQADAREYLGEELDDEE